MATRKKPAAAAPVITAPPATNGRAPSRSLPATLRCLAEYHGEGWALYQGDAVDIARQLPTASIGLRLASLPFSNVYAYSDFAADMGNCLNDAQFFQQFGFLAHESYRVMRPGRILAEHCKDLVDYRGRDGRAGLRDFPGDIVRAYECCNNVCALCQAAGRCPYGQPGPFCALCGGAVTVARGFKLHSKVIIWKCPVLERARTNAHGLLWKSLRADSSFSRQGLMEYVLAFRRWPENEAEQAIADASPITHTEESYPVAEWQQVASPVWVVVEPGPAADSTEREQLAAALAPFGPQAVAAGLAALDSRGRLAIPRQDIDVTNVLNVRMADANRRDEGHMCPLQLDVIERCVRLWSNQGDIVWSPFAGIGSEGVGALRAMRRSVGGGLVSAPRRFIGSELKAEYAELAAANLRAAEPGAAGTQASLFDV